MTTIIFDASCQRLYTSLVQQPALFLQMAALVTSLTLGGSYVLYRGGVLTLPAPAPPVTAAAPDHTELEQWKAGEFMFLFSSGRSTEPVMMSGSKSAMVDFTIHDGKFPLSAQADAPGATRPRPTMLGGSKSVAMGPTETDSWRLLAAVSEAITYRDPTKLQLPPPLPPLSSQTFGLETPLGRNGLTAWPPPVVPNAPTSGHPPSATGTLQLVSEPRDRPVPQQAAASPPPRTFMLGSKSGAIAFASPVPIVTPQPKPNQAKASPAPQSAQPNPAQLRQR